MSPRTPDQDPAEVPDALSYEQAREELVEVVRRLEAGGGTLEESLALWERGEELARVCQERLEGARQRLAAVMGGSPTTPGGGSAEEGPGAGTG